MIRKVSSGDRERWEPLWKGYLDFYEKTAPQAATEYTWQRLTTGAEIEGFLALNDHEEPLGLVHFLYHASTSTVSGNCYLQDLFVVPAARGKRIGRRLIDAVRRAAKDKGVAILYWQTEEFNGTARRLYERVAKRSPFIRYEIEL